MWLNRRDFAARASSGALYHRGAGPPAGAPIPVLARGALLAAALLAPALAQAEPESDDAASGRNYVRRHMWHWVAAIGMSLVDNEYQDRVGYSTDPLLFSDPPGFDQTFRGWLKDDDFEKNFVLDNASDISVGAAFGAAVLSAIGEERAGRTMLDDATGVIEVYLFDKGASGLVKNVIGRQRPEIEFIHEQEDLTPAERELEEAKRTNHQSFYSGATSRQFALAAYSHRLVARRLTGKGARAASFLGFHALAAYVGVSRMQSDRHYLSDVIAGAAAGIFIGRGFYRAHHPEAAGEGGADRRESRLRIASFTAGPDGAALMLEIDLERRRD